MRSLRAAKKKPEEPSAELKAVMEALAYLRDMVNWRVLCRVHATSRDEFIAGLQAAFGVRKLEQDLQSQLLLSHRTIQESGAIETFFQRTITNDVARRLQEAAQEEPAGSWAAFFLGQYNLFSHLKTEINLLKVFEF